MSGTSGGWPVLWPSKNAEQLTIPMSDDGQLMSGTSGGRPVLWPSTNAEQLAVPIGDDGQLMSGTCGGWPVLQLSTNAVRFFSPAVRFFRFFVCTPLLHSSDFSAPLPFLRLFRTTSVPPFRSATILVTFWTVGFFEAYVICHTQLHEVKLRREWDLTRLLSRCWDLARLVSCLVLGLGWCNSNP